jgi:uncharacterized coiled-coil protein SlyX
VSGQTQTETQTPAFSPPQADAAVAALDEQIAAQRRTISEIEGSLKEHKASLAKLTDARRALLRTRAPRKQRTRSAVSVTKTALQRAGRGNVDKARDLLRHNGPTPKAEVTRLLAINDGTVTYALRALEETGEVRKTGERIHGSDVYEYLTPARRSGVTRPGDRR